MLYCWPLRYKTFLTGLRSERQFSEYNEQVLDLALKFRDQGVVGIDFAGNEEMAANSSHVFTENEISMFKRAKQLGIHRTCHAGEAGPAVNVLFAIEQMEAERIGHGYRVVRDEAIYRKCLAENVHFETCPQSGHFTGAISPYEHNPIVRFAEDGANFSINKDDPLTFGSTLDLEYKYLYELGLTEAHVVRAVSDHRFGVLFTNRSIFRFFAFRI